MLAILGDIHGIYRVLMNAAEKAMARGAVALIQVGDFGWYRANINFFAKRTLPLPVYFIDGNHEDHTLLQYDEVTEVFPNLFFVPRGRVLTLDGRRIAFMGGAASVDKAYRLRNGWHWSEGENITIAEAHRFDGVQGVDVFITHCPPQSVIQAHFDPMDLRMFGLHPSWRDPNADIIETLWQDWGYPLVISGHMHRSIKGPNYRILNIDEVMDI